MTLVAVCVAASLSPAAQASASFANRSLALAFSAFKLVGDDGLVDFGLPLSLEGAIYIDNGFEVFLRAAAAIFYQQQFVGPNPGPGFVWGGGGQVGSRYLFLEETWRPYAEVHLAVLGIGRNDQAAAGTEASNAPKVFVGPGAGVGLDVFVSDSISVGGRGFFELYITLNSPPRYAFGGGLRVATYF